MELWKDIPGFEGRYQASNQGRVRSLDRVVICGGHPRRFRGKTLALAPHPAGYLQTSLYVVGVQHSYLVHQLIALTFQGACPAGCEVLHQDHNKRNNVPGNLKYGTRGENIAMDFAAGSRTVAPGFIGARWRARDRKAAA